MRRVVITGAGTINPLGTSAAQTMRAMAKGNVAIKPLNFANSDRLEIQIGAQVQGFDPRQQLTKRDLSIMDRATQFAVLAALEASVQSGLETAAMADRIGVIMGTGGGGNVTADEAYRQVYEEGQSRAHPFTVPRMMHNAPASQISIRHGIRGPSFAVSTACASSNHAMGLAYQSIRTGSVDAVFTGGSESMMSFGGIKAWEGLRVLSPTGCRPFGKDRNGMVIGEGAACFVFEELDHARNRGAAILAEVSGFAMTSDASDIVAPSQDGAQSVMNAAISDAGLSANDIGYVNAHGTGTRANDSTESRAISAVFDRHRPLVSSTKSQHGHLIGAAGGVELFACLLAITQSKIAPTMNVGALDPECDINLVKDRAVEKDIAHAMSNAFAFGGLNAALIVSRFG